MSDEKMSINQKKEFLITARRFMSVKQAAENGQLEAIIFIMDELQKTNSDIFETEAKLDSFIKGILSWCATSHKFSKEKLGEFTEILSNYKSKESSETIKKESYRFEKFRNFKY
jgi:hypothetical protein